MRAPLRHTIAAQQLLVLQREFPSDAVSQVTGECERAEMELRKIVQEQVARSVPCSCLLNCI